MHASPAGGAFGTPRWGPVGLGGPPRKESECEGAREAHGEMVGAVPQEGERGERSAVDDVDEAVRSGRLRGRSCGNEAPDGQWAVRVS
jgi:hypothetical protein